MNYIETGFSRDERWVPYSMLSIKRIFVVCDFSYLDGALEREGMNKILITMYSKFKLHVGLAYE